MSISTDNPGLLRRESSLDELLAKLTVAGVKVPPGRRLIGRFGDSPDLSKQLIGLIRSGAKRASSALLWAIKHDGDPMPQFGDIEIVVDHLGEPALLTRITSVGVVPFDAVTAEYAALEGEGDGSLEYWREEHWRCFSCECARIGREPATGMLVVGTTFELLTCLD